jgi:CrcB protein
MGVGLAGGLGALARWALGAAISSRTRSDFPWGTLTVNLSGALVLGLVVGLALRGDALLLAGTGALGSYTTYSTWLFETHRLAVRGERAAATVNVVASLLAGLAAVALGRLLAG